jgi:hypothetical protein
MKTFIAVIILCALLVLLMSHMTLAQITVTNSNSYAATAENNGRRMVRDGEDVRHLVYEDQIAAGGGWKHPVMYTYSSDGATWSPPAFVATGGSWSANANPSICIYDTTAKQNEILHVVWSGPVYPDTTNGDIFYSSSVVGSGTWTPPINVSNSPGLPSLLPAISIDGSGGIHVVWQEADYDIWYNYCPGVGGLWGTPINISNTPGSSERPSIANTIDYSSDKVHVVWYDYSSVGYPTPFIAYRHYDPAGMGWYPNLAMSPLDATNGTTGLFPCISVGPDDNPHVVWDHGYSAGDVYHATSSDGGLTFHGPTTVVSTVNPFPGASVANISSESLHVVWEECDTLFYPNWYEVYHMVSGDDGATWHNLQLVSTGDEDWSRWPNLAYKMVLHDSCDIAWTDLQQSPHLVMYRRKPFDLDDPWYFKPGYHDYAINGMPDFDQKQDQWDNPPGSGNWTYCGPTAIANCFWWFDSKYQWLINPGSPQPPTVSDDFDLVTAYGTWDDHDRPNVQPLIEDLAWYMDTDGQRTGVIAQGTNVFKMEAAVAEWQLDTETDTIFYEHTRKAPDFYWIEEEIERCEDVILLLGFWQNFGPQEWVRVGGHYVTCAGVNSDSLAIAFSDPYYDMAELGWPGRVGNGVLTPHPPAPHGPGIHNDAGNISHDFYRVTYDSLSPGGPWSIPYYPPVDSIFVDLQGANCPPEFEDQMGSYTPGYPVHTEIEYAVAISPIPDCWSFKGEYPDYAPDGMPDFDQNQHFWSAFCGPTAVANCLWWYDSKYQYLTVGGNPPPPFVQDDFNLVTTYIAGNDDHDWALDGGGYDNVEYLIEDLAVYLGTDLVTGTKPDDMQQGIRQWLVNRGLDDVFYEHTFIDSTLDPDFFYIIEEEIECCQDVILLLGFWQEWGPGNWRRVGGHYVTCAGVCSDSLLIMFSDPDYDQYPITYPDHPKWHNNAALVSHDVYKVAPNSPSPGGFWYIPEYPEEVGLRHEFENCPDHLSGYQEYPEEGIPIHTEIEAAIMVSPFVKPAAVDTLWIYPDGGPTDVNDIRLVWTEVTEDTAGCPAYPYYVIFRDTVSDFTPGPGNTLATTFATEWEDINAAGDTSVNYYYIVRARAGSYESDNSRYVGEFDVDLGNGGPKEVNRREGQEIKRR